MIDPRAQFLTEPEAKEFADFISRPSFKKASVYALAMVASNLSGFTDANARLAGAQQLLSALDSLVTPDTRPTLPNKSLKPT